MLIISVICLLVGLVLGQRFKVLVLLPAVMVTLLVALGIELACAQGLWRTAVTAIATVTSIQMGYLFGTTIHHLLIVSRARRMRPVDVQPARQGVVRGQA